MLVVILILTIAGLGFIEIYVVHPIYENLDFLDSSSELVWLNILKFLFFSLMIYIGISVLYYFGKSINYTVNLILKKWIALKFLFSDGIKIPSEPLSLFDTGQALRKQDFLNQTFQCQPPDFAYYNASEKIVLAYNALQGRVANFEAGVENF